MFAHTYLLRFFSFDGSPCCSPSFATLSASFPPSSSSLLRDAAAALLLLLLLVLEHERMPRDFRHCQPRRRIPLENALQKVSRQTAPPHAEETQRNHTK